MCVCTLLLCNADAGDVCVVFRACVSPMYGAP